MSECFHCGQKAVTWLSDYSFDDFGYDGEGIVQVCQCNNCGAKIYYHISLTKEDEEEIINGTEA